MHISESLCTPQVCSYECLHACTNTHGDDSPIGFRKDSLIPVIDEETCTRCLACIRACPLNAISVEDSASVTYEPTPPPGERFWKKFR